MSYIVHNFKQGDTLYANQLNEMDSQILLNEETISSCASSNIIANNYVKNKYSIGDYVIHENKLYVCIYDINTPENWNSNHWKQVNLGNDVSNIKDTINNGNFNQHIKISPYEIGYDIGQLRNYRSLIELQQDGNIKIMRSGTDSILSYGFWSKIEPSGNDISGHKIYLKISNINTSTAINFKWLYVSSVINSSTGGGISLTITDRNTELEQIFTLSSNCDGLNIALDPGSDVTEGEYFTIGAIQWIDLTAIFGEGYEPNINQFKSIYSNIPYEFRVPNLIIDYNDEKTLIAVGNPEIRKKSEIYENFTNSGSYTITTDDLESGQWSYSRKDDNETRARTKFLIPVHVGMTIDYENTTFDVFFGVLETPTSMTYITGQSEWKTDSKGTFNITRDGYLTFVIRNHVDNTVAVNPSDFNSHVTIKTVVLQSIDELNDDLYTLDKTFSQNLEEINGIYTFPVINGYASDINSIISKNNKWLINSDYLYFNNEFIKITIDNGYNGYILWERSNGTAVARALSSGIHYFYGGKNIPVRILIHKDNQNNIMLYEINHVKIEKSTENMKDIGCGMKEHLISWEKNASINSVSLAPYNNDNHNTDMSEPIKIPESGLRIAVNPIYSSRMYLNQDDPHIPLFRVVAVKKDDNGLILQTDNDGVLAVSETMSTSLGSVYIPYIENCYIFIVVYYPDNIYQDHDYSNFLIVTSGVVNNSYSGVYGIFPTAITVDIVNNDGIEENQLNIRGKGRYVYINSVSGYYATVLRLSEVKRIAVSSQYTIMAVIYKINDDGSVTRYDDIFGTWSIFSSQSSTYMQISTSGVSVIDFDQYDFDGYALIAIQCPVIYNRVPSSYNFLRLSMGGLHGYENVKNNLSVEYKNGITISTISGMPAILDENIRKLCNWNVDVYPSGYYTEQADTVSYYFPDMYNCFPSLYQGTYIANTVLMNVTAKSTLTCLKNPNGRMRKMKRQDDGSGGKGRIGYGITCTNFGSIVRGLRENYTNYDLIYGTNMKFDRIPFNYPESLYDLRPGDLLSKHQLTDDWVMGRSVNAHCMTVSSIVVVNGVIKAVNIIEGSPPAPRLNTYLAMDYYVTDGNPENWITNTFSMEDLKNYTAINRIKHEHLKRITDIYDLYPENTNVGTVMCDRGTESIYGARTHFIELSVSDNEASNLKLFKNGAQIATISLSNASTENDLRVVNVISYIDGEGLYTVETDTEPGITQETFFVKGDVDAMTVSTSGDTVTLTIPNVSDLVFLDIWYGLPGTDFEIVRQRKTLTYLPDDPNQITINSETNTGTVILPKYIDGVPYSNAYRVYNTIYGTYHANPSGRVSSEYYSYDANGDNLNNS